MFLSFTGTVKTVMFQLHHTVNFWHNLCEFREFLNMWHFFNLHAYSYFTFSVFTANIASFLLKDLIPELYLEVFEFYLLQFLVSLFFKFPHHWWRDVEGQQCTVVKIWGIQSGHSTLFDLTSLPQLAGNSLKLDLLRFIAAKWMPLWTKQHAALPSLLLVSCHRASQMSRMVNDGSGKQARWQQEFTAQQRISALQFAPSQVD